MPNLFLQMVFVHVFHAFLAVRVWLLSLPLFFVGHLCSSLRTNFFRFLASLFFLFSLLGCSLYLHMIICWLDRCLGIDEVDFPSFVSWWIGVCKYII